MRIGNVTLKNPFLAAPLAGVTDAAFRGILSDMGAGLTTTEMISGKGLLYENRKTEELLTIWPGEGPVAYQIFGGEPAVMEDTARALAGRDNALLDINAGCPVPKVVKNGEGSALLKDLDRFHDVVAATVKGAAAGGKDPDGAPASPKPVTVKIRTGWDEDHIVAVEAAKAAEAAGASAITVHGRTRRQFYTGKADWDQIAKVKAAVSIPVIGNGDIFAPEDALAMLEQTGCDAVMIARGMLGNPWIFRQALVLWETGEHLPAPTAAERLPLIEDHLARVIEAKGVTRALPEMRKHFGWYSKGLPGAADFRRRINSLTDAGQVLDLVRDYFIGA